MYYGKASFTNENKATMLFQILVLLLTFQFSTSVISNEVCARKLQESHASTKFIGSVAHGIHSMTLAELKKFYATATENNFVPTVNQDLTADQAILMYAPDIKSPLDQSMFETEGMKTLDTVLSRMDNKLWGIKNFSPLEKIVHTFHMKEVFAKTLKQFQKVTLDPPTSEACECALDVGNNGIMNILKYLALVLREPSLVQGNPAYKGFSWDYNIYRYGILDVKILQNGTVDYAAVSRDKSMPHLTDEVSWKNWRNELPPDEQNYDTALFLYCAAKKANGIDASMANSNGPSTTNDIGASMEQGVDTLIAKSISGSAKEEVAKGNPV